MNIVDMVKEQSSLIRWTNLPSCQICGDKQEHDYKWKKLKEKRFDRHNNNTGKDEYYFVTKRACVDCHAKGQKENAAE